MAKGEWSFPCHIPECGDLYWKYALELWNTGVRIRFFGFIIVIQYMTGRKHLMLWAMISKV